MSFTNLYYKRAVGTPKACYVCHKPTTTVLATINTVDFIYSCDGHLTDPGFASQVGESTDGAGGARKLGLSPEEIAKVKEEWEERQRKKKEREKEKEKEKDKEKGGDKDKGKEKEDNGKQDEKGKSTSSASVTPTSTPSTPGPTHQRYTLHRDMFALRLAEHRRRKQTAQVKELAPRLPGAPRGSVI
ncbi:hypothetical protein EIP91_000894 [Steccherinum ochraceum]|uniref:DUF1742-domain-containing protein n=1 Tax=Steccherinum ochraceum TaxID=92696 RepID=A0A4R0RHE9_9APHY|nr:hypothetical protein EIP91_000894 [Steccherinum ochraceum]